MRLSLGFTRWMAIFIFSIFYFAFPLNSGAHSPAQGHEHVHQHHHQHHSAMEDVPKCTVCGMKVNMEGKFASWGKDANNNLVYFCDVGDMLYHLQKNSGTLKEVYVKDYEKNEWIEAKEAFYVQAKEHFRTPMRWGIAAFKNKEDAKKYGEPKTFSEILSTFSSK